MYLKILLFKEVRFRLPVVYTIQWETFAGVKFRKNASRPSGRNVPIFAEREFFKPIFHNSLRLIGNQWRYYGGGAGGEGRTPPPQTGEGGVWPGGVWPGGVWPGGGAGAGGRHAMLMLSTR